MLSLLFLDAALSFSLLSKTAAPVFLSPAILFVTLGLVAFAASGRRRTTSTTHVSPSFMPVVGALIFASTLSAQTTSVIDAVGVAPNTIVAKVPTTVVVTARIADPALIPDSVNLQRIGATGQATVLGALTDTGTKGDLIAGDGIYSLALTMNETILGNVTLQVSAAFFGQLRRATYRLSLAVVGRVEATGIVSSNGGLITVTDQSSPLFGAKVTVPPGAIASNQQYTITLSYADAPPGAPPNGATVSSKVLILGKDDPRNFRQPVLVTLPYDKASIDPADLPAVFYWNPNTNSYRAAGIVSIDRSAGTLTFRTVHFSSFLALTVPGLAQLAFYSVDLDTGFRPQNDGFFEHNFGSYDRPGGSCYAMALFAPWYYKMRKASDGPLYTSRLLRQGDYNSELDDTLFRELISRTYVEVGQIWKSIIIQLEQGSQQILAAGDIALEFWTALFVTHEPQALIIQGTGWSHAVDIYEWDSGRKQFLIYDNADPGHETTLGFSLVSGFGSYSQLPTSPILRYGFDGLSAALDDNMLAALYQGAKQGYGSTKFKTITITSPAIDQTGVATVTGGAVTVLGTVTGGITSADPCCLIYFVNGTPVGTTAVSDNTFQFTLASLPNPVNSLMLVTSNDPKDWDVPWNAYAGFKEIKLQVQGPIPGGLQVQSWDNSYTWNLGGTGFSAGAVNFSASGATVTGSLNYSVFDWDNPTAIAQLFVAVERKVVYTLYNGVPSWGGASGSGFFVFDASQFASGATIYLAGTWAIAEDVGRFHYEQQGGGWRVAIGVIGPAAAPQLALNVSPNGSLTAHPGQTLNYSVSVTSGGMPMPGTVVGVLDLLCEQRSTVTTGADGQVIYTCTVPVGKVAGPYPVNFEPASKPGYLNSRDVGVSVNVTPAE